MQSGTINSVPSTARGADPECGRGKTWTVAGQPIGDIAAFLRGAAEGTVVIETEVGKAAVARVVVGAWFVKAPCAVAKIAAWLDGRTAAKRALGIEGRQDGLFTERQIRRIVGCVNGGGRGSAGSSWSKAKDAMTVAGDGVAAVVTPTGSKSSDGERLYLLACAEKDGA